MVSPETGPIAAFGEADKWVLSEAKKVLAKGITIAGETKRADQPLGGKLEPPKKTIIAVHHDLRTVPQYFDYVVLLNVRLGKYGRRESLDLDRQGAKSVAVWWQLALLGLGARHPIGKRHGRARHRAGLPANGGRRGRLGGLLRRRGGVAADRTC